MFVPFVVQLSAIIAAVSIIAVLAMQQIYRLVSFDHASKCIEQTLISGKNRAPRRIGLATQSAAIDGPKISSSGGFQNKPHG